jgi:hypothetical protein
MPLTALGILAFLVLLTLVGVYLTLTGLFPKRRGDTPYCRNCAYNLTGLDLGAPDTRCPECGGKLHDRAVVFGERVVRSGRLVLGNIILLISLAALALPAIDALRNVRWYELKPTAWVLRDAKSEKAIVAIKAFNELSRRLRDDELAAEHKRELAAICLGHQADPQVHVMIGPRAIDLLGEMYERQALSPDQTEGFLDNMVTFGVRVRPVVVKGQPFPLATPCVLRTPRQMVNVGMSFQFESSGGALMAPPGGALSMRTGVCSYDNLIRYLTLNEPGRHEIACKATVSLYDRKVIKTTSVSVEVLPEEPEQYIRLVSSPELDRAVARAVGIAGLEAGRWHVSRFLQTTLFIDEALPVNLAFDVLGEFDGRQITFGQCTISKDETPGSWTLHASAFWASPPRMTILLKSSAEAAKRTLDLYEICEGELRFENLEVDYPSWW